MVTLFLSVMTAVPAEISPNRCTFLLTPPARMAVSAPIIARLRQLSEDNSTENVTVKDITDIFSYVYENDKVIS